MSTKKENTADKILSVTIDLMSEKGYKAVTVKEIAAAASISEMTVFRTFGSKKAILDTIIDNYLFSAPVEELIKKNLTYELEEDLLMISKLYHDLMKKNKKIYLISLMERNTMPEIHLGVHRNAAKFLEFVTNYLSVMQQKGKVMKGNPQNQALTVMRYHYGRFVANTLLEGMDTVLPENIEEVISIISRGLKT